MLYHRAFAEGFLHLLKAEPTLLPEAPASVTARQMDDRVMDEVHQCLRCGQRAQTALIAETTLGKRWVDMCFRCTEPYR